MKPINICNCGCGKETLSGNRFIHGHNAKGTKMSVEFIEKMRLSKIGSKNPQWKGGKKKCEVCDRLLRDRRSKRCIKHVERVMSKEARKRLSDNRKGSGNPMFGKTLSKEHRDKLSFINKDRRGKKNPNWRGTTPLNKAIREMPESRKLKIEVFIRDNRTCQVPGCLSKKNIEAHHIKSIAELIYNNQLKTTEDALSCKDLFDPKNLVTLCGECHKKTKNYGNSSFNYFVDDRGIIKDLFVGKSFNAMTTISFEKGSVRGNHRHPLSTQQDFIVNGLLLVSNGEKESIVGTGDIVEHKPNTPHAYKAIINTTIISFFSGVRQGIDYEKDTIRLEEPLL